MKKCSLNNKNEIALNANNFGYLLSLGIKGVNQN